MTMRAVRTSAVLGVFALCCFAAVGCHSDEPVGHSKSTVKHTTETPTQKTTVTETKTKDTKVYPNN